MRKYIILLFVSLLIYLFHFVTTKHGIYGDGNGYFALAHTLFFQHNLNFRPIYHYLSNFQGASYIFSRVFWDIRATQTGVLNCPWLIGTSLFWIPSFMILWVINIFFNLRLGIFHPLFEFGCGVSGIVLVLGGLFFIEKYIRTFVDKTTSFLVVFSLFFSTQLFYYGAFEPALSHQVAFFLVSLYLYLSKKRETLYLTAFAALGLGLLSITRMSDGILLLPFILNQFFIWFKKRTFMHYFVFIACVFIGFVPQLLLQKSMYGSFFANPYLQGEKGSFFLPTLSSFWNQLFSLQGGFFLWSPLFIVALIGMYVMVGKKKYKQIGTFSLTGIFIFTLVLLSWFSRVPAGFGNRFFISSIPLFAIGLAYFFSRHRRVSIWFAAFCVLWNIMLLILFYI